MPLISPASLSLKIVVNVALDKPASFALPEIVPSVALIFKSAGNPVAE